MPTPTQLRKRAEEYRSAADRLENAADEMEQKASSVSKIYTATINSPPAKRGRPKGSGKKAAKVAPIKTKKTKGKRAPAKNGEKTSLGDLLLLILEDNPSGLTIAELVRECYKRGYQSKSSSFTNIVAQTVNRLPGVDRQGRKYLV
ncbi:MAG: hypothetical protein DWQ19_09695 [Crenarchaeota archaeon]|nr:MAG: hypothetical protein DWQ19_09695 [Thermoproteota archaeon]